MGIPFELDKDKELQIVLNGRAARMYFEEYRCYALVLIRKKDGKVSIAGTNNQLTYQ
jgi:hypothetical protein